MVKKSFFAYLCLCLQYIHPVQQQPVELLRVDGCNKIAHIFFLFIYNVHFKCVRTYQIQCAVECKNQNDKHQIEMV